MERILWIATMLTDRYCREIEKQGICPARDFGGLICPLGDDGICENCNVEDWIRVLENFKKED